MAVAGWLILEGEDKSNAPAATGDQRPASRNSSACDEARLKDYNSGGHGMTCLHMGEINRAENLGAPNARFPWANHEVASFGLTNNRMRKHRNNANLSPKVKIMSFVVDTKSIEGQFGFSSI